MTPDAFEAVHNFILFSMDAQEKMGKLFSEEDLVKEIEKGESFLYGGKNEMRIIG